MNRRLSLELLMKAAYLAGAYPVFGGTKLKVKSAIFSLYESLIGLLLGSDFVSATEQAKLASYMSRYIDTCLLLKTQIELDHGAKALEQFCQSNFNSEFILLAKSEQILLVEQMFSDSDNTIFKNAEDWIYSIRAITLFCYFSSQKGATVALEYLPIPSKYIGDIPLSSTTKAWSL